MTSSVIPVIIWPDNSDNSSYAVDIEQCKLQETKQLKYQCLQKIKDDEFNSEVIGVVAMSIFIIVMFGIMAFFARN